MHRCAPRAASQGGSVWRRAEGPVNTTIQPPLRGAGELLSRVTNKTLPADMRGILKNSFFCVCVCVWALVWIWSQTQIYWIKCNVPSIVSRISAFIPVKQIWIRKLSSCVFWTGDLHLFLFLWASNTKVLIINLYAVPLQTPLLCTHWFWGRKKEGEAKEGLDKRGNGGMWSGRGTAWWGVITTTGKDLRGNVLAERIQRRKKRKRFVNL